MKFYALPLAAILICVALLLHRQQKITDAESSLEQLEQRVTQAEKSRTSQAVTSSTPTACSTATKSSTTTSTGMQNSGTQDAASEDGDITAEKYMDIYAQMDAGQVDIQTLLEIQERVYNLSWEEKEALMQGIQASDRSDALKTNALMALLQPTLADDPGRAFALLDQYGPENLGNSVSGLPHHFATWAKDDPQASFAWLQKKIDAGQLRNKSLDPAKDPKLPYLSGILAHRLSTDPDQARELIADIPPEAQSELFNHSFLNQFDPENEPALVSFLQENIDPSAQGEILSEYLFSPIHFDPTGQKQKEDRFARVQTFLAENDFEPSVTSELATDTTERVLRSDFSEGEVTDEALQAHSDFLQQYAPDQRIKTLAESLAAAANARHQFGGDNSPEARQKRQQQALQHLARLHQQEQDDELLTAYFSRLWNPKDVQPGALELINQIQDEKQRQKILRRLNLDQE